MVQDVKLDQVEIIRSLFDDNSLQAELFNVFMKYLHSPGGKFIEKHKNLCLRLLLSSTYGVNANLRKDIQNEIQELFQLDNNMVDPNWNENRAKNNLHVCRWIINELSRLCSEEEIIELVDKIEG